MKIVTSIIISILILFAPEVLAADSFTQDQAQGLTNGGFAPLLDDNVSGNEFSQNNVQGGIHGFMPVFDEAAGAAAPAPGVPDRGVIIID